MGADVVAKGRYECSHGCFWGDCKGHDFAAWYREGFYYISVDGGNYRDGLCIDRNLLDAIVESWKHESM